jgi:uncharacterized membrane protein
LVNKGVIFESVADAIRVHYGEVKGFDTKWFITLLCSVLGAFIIGLGVILLFGHNWENFSRLICAIF